LKILRSNAWHPHLMEPVERRTLLSAGQLDNSFGAAGSITAGEYPSFNLSAIAVQNDGKTIVAGNSDADSARTSWITVDRDLHSVGSRPLTCAYSTDASQIGQDSSAPEARNGAAIRITVPPGGFVVFH